MAAYDDIYSLSTENHGIVTTRDARGLGVRTKDIARWVKMGRLIKVGFGVYRTSQYPITATNANFISVAVPGRLRRSLPDSYVVVRGKPGYVPSNANGIPCQRVADAIRSCIGHMMPERLEQAASGAFAEGLVTDEELKDIRRDIAYVG